MIKINQNKPLDLIQTKKTVDWLVSNTSVSVFDPITFKGYQRKIDSNHSMRIVEYLKRDFFMPTSIICATDEEYCEKGKLRVVDGQHRINAFKIIKNEDPIRYSQIKEYEVPIIVMAKVDENTEIDTFITINKTSKKVDTSLALVLKNKQNKYNSSEDLTMSKAEYIAVELAQMLNFKNDINNIWYDKILFEGSPKKTLQLISLNAFVKSTRVLLNHMARKKLISLNWTTNKEIQTCLDDCYGFILSVWSVLQKKWPELFNSELENRRIIQGAIGYSSINKVIIELLNLQNGNEYEFMREFENRIKHADIVSNKWLPGGIYSKYSSESGYRIVCQELLSAMKL